MIATGTLLPRAPPLAKPPTLLKLKRFAHSLDVSEETGVRSLHFGSDWVQGAMRIKKPDVLELEYTREMLACLLWKDWTLWPREVLLIGLGAGSLAKFLYRQLPHARLHVVEIDPRIPAFARQNFALPDDPQRIVIDIADGADFIRSCPEKFDLILVDGFDHRARAGDLETIAFYRHCLAHLESGGIMSTNLFGTLRGFERRLSNVIDAFDRRVVMLPSGEVGNVIVFGLQHIEGEVTLADLRQRARVLNDQTGLNLKPLLKRLIASGMLPGGVIMA